MKHISFARTCQTQRGNRSFCTTAHHDVSVAIRNQPRRVADRVHAGRARSRHTVVGTLHETFAGNLSRICHQVNDLRYLEAELHADVTSCHVEQDLGDEEGRDSLQAVFSKLEADIDDFFHARHSHSDRHASTHEHTPTFQLNISPVPPSHELTCSLLLVAALRLPTGIGQCFLCGHKCVAGAL